jgi:hypothetical protein
MAYKDWTSSSITTISVSIWHVNIWHVTYDMLTGWTSSGEALLELAQRFMPLSRTFRLETIFILYFQTSKYIPRFISDILIKFTYGFLQCRMGQINAWVICTRHCLRHECFYKYEKVHMYVLRGFTCFVTVGARQNAVCGNKTNWNLRELTN